MLYISLYGVFHCLYCSGRNINVVSAVIHYVFPTDKYVQHETPGICVLVKQQYVCITSDKGLIQPPCVALFEWPSLPMHLSTAVYRQGRACEQIVSEG